MSCKILILRSLRSGDRIGLGPSEDGGVYVKDSSLSFRQPFAAEFARDVKEGIFSRGNYVVIFVFVVTEWDRVSQGNLGRWSLVGFC